MIKLLLQVFREQKSIVIFIVCGLTAIGLIWGMLKRPQIKIRELDPKEIYAEMILSKISTEEKEWLEKKEEVEKEVKELEKLETEKKIMENQNGEIKPETEKTVEKKSQNNSLEKDKKKKSVKPMIDKTPLDDQIQIFSPSGKKIN